MTDFIGPPKPLPPRNPGDTLHLNVMSKIAAGYATSYTDNLAVAFYMSSGSEYATAVGRMLVAFNVPRSRFLIGPIRGCPDCG